jgi:hypothetical protein
VRLPRGAERPPPSALVANDIPQKAGFQSVSAHTLDQVKDKGTGAENLIWLASRQSGRANPSALAADDILAALTGRIAELEARVSEILAEVEPELPPVHSKPGSALSAPKADAGGTEKMSRDERVEADGELTRASEERRMLANEMRLLREAFQEARRSQLSAGPGANAVEAQVAPDFRAAIADEMRSLLTELFADFRARPAVPPPVVEHVAATTEIVEDVVVNAPIVEPLIEDAATASPPADPLVTEAAPIQSIESVIEHVDELERLAPSGTIVDEYVEDLRGSRKLPPADPPRVEAAAPEPAAPIVDAYVEELSAPEAVAPTDALDLVDAPADPAPPIVDESVFEALESAEPIVDERLEALRGFIAPPPEMVESSAPTAEPIEPIVDEYAFEPLAASEPIVEARVEDLLEREAPPSPEMVESSAPQGEPIEPIVDQYFFEPPEAAEQIVQERLADLPLPEMVEWSAPPAEAIEPIVEASAAPSEPIVEEFIEELPRPAQIEPIAPYSVPPEPAADTQIAPPSLPATPDARIDALWNAATSWPKAAETAPPPSFEPASFVTEESIPETHPLEVPEAAGETSSELVQETPTEFTPEPPISFAPTPTDFAPAPPTEFAPDVAAIPEPAMPLEPRATEAAPQSTFAPIFPELRVADERGLHQIQVVISPIHSFPRLLETERRIRALSTVNALHLRDFRNGVATLTVSVGEAISPAEFGAVIQMLEELHLRLEGTTQSSVELRAEDEPPTS